MSWSGARLSPRRLDADGIRIDLLRLGDWHGLRPESLGASHRPTPSKNSSGERRRQGATTRLATARSPVADRGGLAPTEPVALERDMERRRTGSRRRAEPTPTAGACRLHGRWTHSSPRQATLIVVVAVARGSPDTAGRSNDGVAGTPTARPRRSAGEPARAAIRGNAVAAASQLATLDARDSAPLLIFHTRSWVPTRYHIVATQTSTTVGALPPPTRNPQTAGHAHPPPVDTPHTSSVIRYVPRLAAAKTRSPSALGPPLGGRSGSTRSNVPHLVCVLTYSVELGGTTSVRLGTHPHRNRPRR